MPLSVLFRIALILLVLPFIYACSGSSSGGLIGDFQEQSKCPPSGCADAGTKPENVYIERSDKADIYLGANDSVIDLSGSCSASTYPNNRIEVTASGATLAVKAINQGSTVSSAKCSMGKFQIYIDACQPLFRNPAPAVTIQVALVPLDDNNRPVSVTGASFAVSVVRQATNCP